MYVCLYIGMYVCVYAYMYVCMYVRMYVDVYVCMCVCRSARRASPPSRAAGADGKPTSRRALYMLGGEDVEEANGPPSRAAGADGKPTSRRALYMLGGEDVEEANGPPGFLHLRLRRGPFVVVFLFELTLLYACTSALCVPRRVFGSMGVVGSDHFNHCINK